MIVKIDELSHDFRGIARVNNKVTFIPNALPNETIDIRIINDKKKISVGEVISYLEKIDDRVNPKCPYYGKCGGCDISHVNYKTSLNYKKKIVQDILKRYANIDINMDIVPSDSDYNYRNKISLKVNNEKLSLVDISNNLININECLLVNDNINKVIKIINNINLAGVQEVIVKGIKEIMVIIKGKIDKNILINNLKVLVSSIILNDRVIYGNKYINIKIKDIDYAIYPLSFFQVNNSMIEKLYDKIKEYATSGESLLDLYCGAGTIGIYLADNFKKIKGIEINKDAVESANKNKEINGINNISFECKNVNEIDNISDDVVIVDPPRNGLDKITINKLLEGYIHKIVYVSCSPITLARDLGALKSKYELEDITLLDMFPNTKHVECVCVLNRQ